MAEQDETVPIATRVTRRLQVQLDEIAADLNLSRGNVVTLILAAGVSRQEDLLKTYRELIAANHKDRGSDDA